MKSKDRASAPSQATRKPRRRVLQGVVVLVLALGMVEFFPGARGLFQRIEFSKAVQTVARVNEANIPLGRFNLDIARQLNALAAKGLPHTVETAASQGLVESVLDRLVEGELLAQEAEARGLAVSPTALRRALEETADFRVAGKFSPQRYRDALATELHQSDVLFERELRRDLLAGHMAAYVEGLGVVSEDEARAHFRARADKVRASFVRFSAPQFSAKVPPGAEVDRYVAQHGRELEERYRLLKGSFERPEQLRTRHILIKLSATASAPQVAAATARLAQAKAELDAGKDFADVARRYSEDEGTVKQGGDLGFMARSALLPEYAKVAWPLKNDEVSPPVRTRYGLHLLQVTGRTEALHRGRAEALRELATHVVAEQRAGALAQREAAQTQASLRAGKHLSDLYPPAPASHPEPPGLGADAPGAPGPGGRGPGAPGPSGAGPGAHGVQGALGAGGMGHGALPLAGSGKVGSQKGQLGKAAAALVALGAAKHPLDPAAQHAGEKAPPALGLVVVDSGEFSTAAESVPQLGSSAELLADVRSSKAAGGLPRLYQVADAWVVVELTERTMATDAKWAETKASTTEEIRKEKGQAMARRFVKGLEMKGKVFRDQVFAEKNIDVR